MNDSTIYISRRCPHCQELLILIHKNRDILRFKIIDIDKEPFPKKVTTVPSMLIGEKILPGQELFKFLTYIINQKKGNNISVNRENMGGENMGGEDRGRMGGNMGGEDNGRMDIGEMNRASMNNGEIEKSNNNSDIVELDGFSSFSGGSDLGFSLLDDSDNDNNLDMPFEFLNSSTEDNTSEQLSGSGNDYKSEKKTQFDNDYEEMMQSRGSLNPKNDNNQMGMRTF